MDSADGDDLRQMAVVDDEAARDGGEEGVVDQTGDEGRAARENTEGAVVAFFIEFGHCEYACLTITVDDETCQRHEQREGEGEVAPEFDGVAGTVFRFELGDDGDQTHAGRAVRNGQQITARLSSGGEESRHVVRVMLRHNADDDDGNQWNGDDRPV